MNWDEYLMAFADLAARKSKDSTQVGAILARGRQVLCTGFNGPPRGVRDLPEIESRPRKIMGAYVYAHTRKDNGAIFYIGKGTGRRAWSASSRNRHWKFIYSKHGREVWILAESLSDGEAYDLEQLLISKIPNGSLATFTDGGKGICGYKHTKKAKQNMSRARTGRARSDKMRQKLSETIQSSPDLIEMRRAAFSGELNPAKAAKNRTASSLRMTINNPMFFDSARNKMVASKKGREISKDHRDKIRQSLKGKKRGPMPDKVREAISIVNEKKKRPVITACGLRFSSTLEAANALGIWQGSIVNNCLGRQKTAGGYVWRYEID